MREVPKESNEDDQKAGECEERLKDLGIFSLRKEMAQEEHHDSILALKRQLQRGQRLSSTQGTTRRRLTPRVFLIPFYPYPSISPHQAST